MSSKHNILTKKEFDSSELNPGLMEQIDLFLVNNPTINKEDLQILDWGCGRGISVLKLLQKGYSAYGLDIDHAVMKNGYDLFKTFGYVPEERLMHLNDINLFKDNSFHVVFSEQVFEHVEEVEKVIRSQSGLLCKGGVGFHVFPASKMLMEGHLRMPLVHWLPKNALRKIWILLMMLVKMKPQKNWPEVAGKNFFQEAQVYYDYSISKTFYRDNRALKKLFNEFGFNAKFISEKENGGIRNLLPDGLLKNGFPDQQVTFLVEKVS